MLPPNHYLFIYLSHTFTILNIAHVCREENNRKTHVKGLFLHCQQDPLLKIENSLGITTEQARQRGLCSPNLSLAHLLTHVLAGLKLKGWTVQSYVHSPSWIFWYRIITCSSRSCRLCSWRKPRACISSWIARPLFSHPEPSDSCCLPPRIPTWDQHLWKRGILVNSLLHPSRNRPSVFRYSYLFRRRKNIDKRNRRIQVIVLA